MQKIRIMLAGTRRTSFHVLTRILERASDNYVVMDQAWEEAEARKLLQSNGADLVLMDASAPDAFELCSRLMRGFPELCVVLVGGRRSYEWLKRAMDAGARGYISEDECTGECMRAEISRVLRSKCGPAEAVVQPPAEYEFTGRSRAVAKAVDFVRQNYRRNISVAEAAEYAGISESHLRRCFRQDTDLSFVDFLTKYRIDTAKALMDKGNLPIHRISEETGFSSTRYFCRVFKKISGMTPREYMMKQGDEANK